MNPGHLENQRIKLSRQIAKDKLKIVALDKRRQEIARDIERAERLKAQVEKKLKTA